MSNLCPACQAENRSIAKFCRYCGLSLPKDDSSPVPQNEEALAQNVAPSAECLHDTTAEADFIGLSEVRSQLEMFINTLLIRQKQRKIGMPVAMQTKVLVFRGETGTGKSLVAEWFIARLKKSGCLSGERIERSTLHKLQRLYQYDVDIAKYLSEHRLAVLLVDDIQTDQNYLHKTLKMGESSYTNYLTLRGENRYGAEYYGFSYRNGQWKIINLHSYRHSGRFGKILFGKRRA